MMFAKTFGATTLGIDGMLIEVEADVTNGLPKFEIVGLADMAVREAKERVRAAIRNAGVSLMPKRITINLAPADLKKMVQCSICRLQLHYCKHTVISIKQSVWIVCLSLNYRSKVRFVQWLVFCPWQFYAESSI